MYDKAVVPNSNLSFLMGIHIDYYTSIVIYENSERNFNSNANKYASNSIRVSKLCIKVPCNATCSLKHQKKYFKKYFFTSKPLKVIGKLLTFFTNQLCSEA